MMKLHDHVISDLVWALDAIVKRAQRRHDEDPMMLLAYIEGLAEGAQSTANAHRTRNSDGYLVIEEGAK